MAQRERTTYIHYGKKDRTPVDGQSHDQIIEGVIRQGERLPNKAFKIEELTSGQVVGQRVDKKGDAYILKFNPRSKTNINGFPVSSKKV